jgi:DNA repair protein RadC
LGETLDTVIHEMLGPEGVVNLKVERCLTLLAATLGVEQGVMALAWRRYQRVGEFRGLGSFVDDVATARHPIPGIGASKRRRLCAALAFAAALAEQTLHTTEILTSPAACERFLLHTVARLQREVFLGLFLDSRNGLLVCEELFAGTIDSAAVYPRVVVERALTVGAAAVIVAHNHPSGACQPSRADEKITERLKNALALVDVRLLDHFIVGRGTVVSLANLGIL